MHDITSRDDWPPGRVLVLAATYNEQENIAALIGAVLAAAPAAQMLVIDDDSPDGTAATALEIAARDPRVHVLVRRGRRGLGSAILEGLQLAKARGFELAANMDADFSHDPADVPRLLAALEPSGRPPYDIAIGSRRVPGGKTVGWPLHRHLISRAISWFTWGVLRVPVRDASSGFRAIRLPILDRLGGDFFGGYAFFEHLLWAVHRAGGRMVEVPITFTNRRLGESKADFAEVRRGIGELLALARITWLGR